MVAFSGNPFTKKSSTLAVSGTKEKVIARCTQSLADSNA